MKLDCDEDAPDGLFRHHRTLQALERQLYAHAREVGDLRTLSGMEQVLFDILSDELGVDLALDLSRMMVTHAIECVLHDPDRDVTSVPHGISRTERMAAFFEVGCPFCEARVDVVEPADTDEDVDCECCVMLVREWRAAHADALRQFKHGPSRTATKA